MDELEAKIKLIAEHYGNDLSAFLRDAYSLFAQDRLSDDDQCRYDKSWCLAKCHKDGYCFNHWLEEEICKDVLAT